MNAMREKENRAVDKQHRQFGCLEVINDSRFENEHLSCNKTYVCEGIRMLYAIQLVQFYKFIKHILHAHAQASI